MDQATPKVTKEEMVKSLCLIKHLTIKTCKNSVVSSIIILALDKGEWSATCTGPLYPCRIKPLVPTEQVTGWPPQPV